MASIALKTFVGLHQTTTDNHHSVALPKLTPISQTQTRRRFRVLASKSSPKITGRNLRVAVVGGGPAGGAAAETLSKGGIETFLIERKLDNCKPCGGAIPLCMVGEFDLPLDIIDRKVTKMKMISPSNVAVDIGQTLKPHEYIGMVRREILDAYLRDRAAESGANVINGLFLKMDMPESADAPYVLHYSDYNSKTGAAGGKKTLEVDAVIGADGANSRVAKSINAGDYEYAIAFQERVKIPDAKMKYYENLAEMYVGDDVSPDFYGWVFPKCDHVAVGTGTVTHKGDIKKFQSATRLRARDKILGGKIIRVEAHPIPEHPRPRRLSGRVALVGDAAGYVTKCSGEGIYFAAKSGRMCAEAVVEGSENGRRMVEEGDLRKYLEKWDKTYWPTYKVLAETVYSSSSWLRALSSARRRTRAELPTRRSFGHPRADPPDVITQRVLQWRTSIYEQRLEAIPSTSRVTLEQGVTGNSGFRERILQRIEPWIRRELQAVLRDPDPSVIVHVVTSLFMSILEKKQKASSEQGDIEDRYLEPLRPFLHESTEIFWHELRCFAESSYNLETYDTTVQYKKRRVS